MQVRKAKVGDAKGIVETHYDAIHNTAKADYDKDTLKSWHEGVTKSRIEKIKQILIGGEEEIFVCDDNGRIVGFSSIVPKKNELRSVYVHSDYGGKGIGSQLLQALEERAFELNLSHLWFHSSITAQNFYMKHGYKVLKKELHTLSNGTKMNCVVMEKFFESKIK